MSLTSLVSVSPSLDLSPSQKGTTSSTPASFSFGSKFCFQALESQQPVGVLEAALAIQASDEPAQINTTGITLGKTITREGARALAMISVPWPIFLIRCASLLFPPTVAYDDQDDSWPQFLDNLHTWSCRDKIQHAKFAVTYPPCSVAPQPLWSQVDTSSGDQCWTLRTDGDGRRTYTINIVIDTITQVTRPRYWFFSFMKCDEEDGGVGVASLDYHLHFTQTKQSNWNHEFGSNETGLNSLYLAFFIIFTILLAIHSFGTYRLSRHLHYLHPLVKLFLILLIFEYFSILALLLHYVIYGRDGLGITALWKLGTMLDLFSRSMFILVLMLVGQGWTISQHDKVPFRGSMITIVVGYFGFNVGIQFYSYAIHDPMYSTPSAIVQLLTILVNVIWILFGLIFVYSIFLKRYRTELNPYKKTLYLRLGLIFSPWMLLPPIASLLSLLIDPWARDRVVTAFTLSITILAYSIMAFLFWPSRAEKYFKIDLPDLAFATSGRKINGEYEQI